MKTRCIIEEKLGDHYSGSFGNALGELKKIEKEDQEQERQKTINDTMIGLHDAAVDIANHIYGSKLDKLKVRNAIFTLLKVSAKMGKIDFDGFIKQIDKWQQSLD
jgi:predicted HAD superfamily Cof-like phosphohydrolase